MPPPRLILTCGEPAGIGPDLCIDIAGRAWPCELIVAGDTEVLQARAQQLRKPVSFLPYQPGDARTEHRAGTLRVLHVPVASTVRPGQLDRAIDGCMSGEFAAMVTAPVQKSVINDAGIKFWGHTEYLAERTGGAHPVMMLASGSLRVALATTHLPLKNVSAAITRDLLHKVLRIVDHDLRTRFAIPTPRIIVCGLNPHAGESGHLGREEIEVIAPAIDALRGTGMQLIGPVPADTAFTTHMLKQADAVLAMFHDQGLPVIKYAGFETAVNVTLGLPIIRTSVDHGTALSLAGTGTAESGSLATAIEVALQLATASH